MLADAARPWWLIGSAAALLHGADVTVADVDVLVDEADMPLLARAGLVSSPGRPDERFRSALFARWTAPPVAVEFMAGLHLAEADGWSPIRLATREPVAVGPATLFVPGRAELRQLLLRFGRPKDIARAALL